MAYVFECDKCKHHQEKVAMAVLYLATTEHALRDAVAAPYYRSTSTPAPPKVPTLELCTNCAQNFLDWMCRP